MASTVHDHLLEVQRAPRAPCDPRGTVRRVGRVGGLLVEQRGLAGIRVAAQIGFVLRLVLLLGELLQVLLRDLPRRVSPFLRW